MNNVIRTSFWILGVIWATFPNSSLAQSAKVEEAREFEKISKGLCYSHLDTSDDAAGIISNIDLLERASYTKNFGEAYTRIKCDIYDGNWPSILHMYADELSYEQTEMAKFYVYGRLLHYSLQDQVNYLQKAISQKYEVFIGLKKDKLSRPKAHLTIKGFLESQIEVYRQEILRKGIADYSHSGRAGRLRAYEAYLKQLLEMEIAAKELDVYLAQSQ